MERPATHTSVTDESHGEAEVRPGGGKKRFEEEVDKNVGVQEGGVELVTKAREESRYEDVRTREETDPPEWGSCGKACWGVVTDMTIKQERNMSPAGSLLTQPARTGSRQVTSGSPTGLLEGAHEA